MSLRNCLVRLSICLLAHTAQAADPRPAELVHATRAEAQACEDDADRLKQQQAAVDADLDAVQRRREVLDGELAALQADERVVDDRSAAALAAFNSRVDRFNQRMDAHNRDVTRINELAQAVSQGAQAQAARCAPLRLDPFTQEALKQARVNPNPPAIERLAQQRCQALVDAILVGDFDRTADLTHPLALQQLPKNFAAAWREKLLPLRSPGFELVRIDCDMPTQISPSGTPRLAVLRAILFVDTPKGLMLVPVHKLGILSSEAEGWKFVQLPDAETANGAELTAIKRLLPAGLDSITVPKRPAPLMLPRLRG